MDQAPSSDAAHTLVRHFEPAVQDAFARFQTTRSPDDANVVILAIVWDHAPDRDLATASDDHDRLHLIKDLNFDSVAIAEMIFFIEDLFGIRISNDEIRRLSTIGELRGFVREKLGGPAAP